jgi:DNA-binding NtrC family response regulator
MGSKSASGGVGALPGTERVVIVGENNRNLQVMTEALAGYSVTAATSPEQLNPVLSGALPASLVVVDTDAVTEDVQALVERVLDEEIEVVLLSEEPSPEGRNAAASVDQLMYREKPLRSTDLRGMVSGAVN